MGAKAQSARDYIFNQQPKRELVPTPFWPEWDGAVFIQDVPSDEIDAIQEDSKVNGVVQTSKSSAGMVIKCLVVREDDGTYSNIFVYPDDLGQVAHLGTSLLVPVMEKTTAFFGWTAKTVEAAKNDSEPMLNNGSGIGSVPNAIIVQ